MLLLSITCAIDSSILNLLEKHKENLEKFKQMVKKPQEKQKKMKSRIPRSRSMPVLSSEVTEADIKRLEKHVKLF